jgi:cyanoexosortase B-associated protein
MLVVLLSGLVAIAALPHYLSGQWPWSTAMPVPQLNELRALTTTPLTLENWVSTAHQEVTIGGGRWNLAEYLDQAANDSTAGFAVLLRPQTDPKRQPEVEWVDLRGSQGWRVSDQHTVQFAVTDKQGPSVPVSARFFRGLGESSTLAVMQWYAWPTGGHFAPGRWFWVDQWQQLRRRERMPWVAVSIVLPIEPVGNIRPHTAELVAIAQAVQSQLDQTVFRPT